MTIVCKWAWGTTLYLKTDQDQKPRQLVGVMTRPTGTLYELTCGASGSWHYEFEITEQPNNVTKLQLHGA